MTTAAGDEDIIKDEAYEDNVSAEAGVYADSETLYDRSVTPATVIAVI